MQLIFCYTIQLVIASVCTKFKNSKSSSCLEIFDRKNVDTHTGGGVAQWLGRRISDQGVPGSNPGRCTFRCGLEQVTFTLLSTG